MIALNGFPVFVRKKYHERKYYCDREIWSDHWGGVGRGYKRRLPEAMVHSLGWDSLRSWKPPELWGSLWLSLPQEYLDDCAAAACISQGMVFWMRRISRCSLRSSWPGTGWQVYSSLGVLGGVSCEADSCRSSKIV